MKSRFHSLDEAVAHINSAKEVKPEAQLDEGESRWWSYTSKQNIVPEGEAAQHVVSDDLVNGIPGIRYQKCGGGRRIIRKHTGGRG